MVHRSNVNVRMMGSLVVQGEDGPRRVFNGYVFHFLTKQLLLSDFAVSKANLSGSCFHSTTQVFVPTILSKVRC